MIPQLSFLLFALMGAATMVALMATVALFRGSWFHVDGLRTKPNRKQKYIGVFTLGVFINLLLQTLTTCLLPYQNDMWQAVIDIAALASYGFLTIEALVLMQARVKVWHWVTYSLPYIFLLVINFVFQYSNPMVYWIAFAVTYFWQLLLFFISLYYLQMWDKKMLEKYSNVSHKTTLWFRQLTIPAQLLGVLCTYIVLFPYMQWVWIVYYLLLIGLMLRFTMYALQQEEFNMITDEIGARDKLMQLEGRLSETSARVKQNEGAETVQDAEVVAVSPTDNPVTEEDVTPVASAPPLSEALPADVAGEDVDEEEEMPPDEEEETDEVAARVPLWVENLNRLMQEDHLYRQSELDIVTLAERVGVNRTYLSQYINRVLGCSFYEYVNEFRLQESLVLLNDPDLNIESVALQSGFSNQSVFSRSFRKRFAMSPSQWRKSAHKN